MYENPKLVRVGKVEEVVLGSTPTGGDIDGTFTIADLEFAEELDPETHYAP